MSGEAGQGGVSPVQFTGKGSELFGLLAGGYFMMLPTIGIYRFWVTTAKRRYYWQNTVLDGEPLEYTGNAIQLLIGFLFALAFFLPIYVAFFYLSTQTSDIALMGYGAVVLVIWFLGGYATYRARDFRLSRTLWRGIRFDQKGSAMGYAVRRFGWSVLMIVTLGLAYPFMAGNLWKYRYTHSWYGDRRFAWTGSWKTIAGPYYKVWFLVVALAIATLVALGSGDYTMAGGVFVPGPSVWLFGILTLLALWLGWLYFRSREATRMFSAIRLGDAAVTVKVRARTLFGQFLIYSLCLLGVAIVFGLLMALFLSIFGRGFGGGAADLARIAQASVMNAAILIVAYLTFLGSLGILSEVILGLGFWSAVSKNAVITNPESLRSVRSTGEDGALVGEGLADALNVGAY
jgi:uncharacterized membrane protein YjgN (DUF898 family)